MLQRFFLRKLVSPLNTLVYRLSGGRMMAKSKDVPLLLLTTTGRRSHKARTAPLLFLEEGDAFIVIASFGGQPEHPAWYLNLEADPHATVQIGRQELAVRAETLHGDDRERLWKRITDAHSSFEGYKRKTTRTIPVVALRRT